MGTSDKVLDYLSSPKNYVGLALGAVAAAVTIPTGAAGALWPVVAAASYALGAVLAPGSRHAAGQMSLDRVYTADELREALEADAALATPDIQGAVERVVEPMRDVLSRWDRVEGSSQVSMDASSLILDYLPTTIRNYLALPKYLRANKRDEVTRQLGVLADYAAGARDAAFADDVAAFEAQGAFLDQKWRKNALDL